MSVYSIVLLLMNEEKNMLQLRVRLTSNPDGDDENQWPTFWFHQKEGKRASFLLESSEASPMKIEKPSHLLVDCFPASVTGSPWLFGSLEILSNSRNIEVYAVPEGKKDGDYWQTYRGSRVENAAADDDTEVDSCEKELYQTTILPPSSKPETITRLHIKLLSLRPARCPLGFVKSMKLKGRLPDIVESVPIPTEIQVGNEAVADNTTLMANVPTQKATTVQHQQETQRSQQPFSSGDPTEKISSAVAGLTMLIQNIHSSMEKSIESTVGEVQKLAYAQNEKIADLEKSVNRLSDTVEMLVTEMKLLRTQNSELPEALVKEKSNNSLHKNEEPVVASIAVEDVINLSGEEAEKKN